jgi:hypothetical protein
MAKQKAADKATESIPQSEGAFYVKDGAPIRAVYTPADRAQAEWDGYKPAETKANQQAVEELAQQVEQSAVGDQKNLTEDSRP